MAFTEYTIPACATLLIYDVLCLLDDELEFIWNSPWGTYTLLYLLNRYLPFVDIFIQLYMSAGPRSVQSCLRGYSASTWFLLLGIILSETILMLRTYAIWQRNRSVLIFLCTIATITFLPAIVLVKLELDSLKYESMPPGLPANLSKGCRLTSASQIVFVGYVLLMLSETAIVVLTMTKAFHHIPRSRSAWVRRMYQDGLLFYVYVLLLSIANLIMPLVAPARFQNWLATPQRVLHSVLCARVLLGILKQRKLDQTPADQTPSHLVFSTLAEGEDRLDRTVLSEGEASLV